MWIISQLIIYIDQMNTANIRYWTQLLPKFFLFIIIKKTSVKSSHHKRRPSVYGWHNALFDAWKQLKFLPSKSLLCPWIWIVKLVFIEKVFEIYLFNRSWHISTTPNTTKKFLIVLEVVNMRQLLLKNNLEFTKPSWHCCAMQYNTITGKGKNKKANQCS